MKWTLVRTLGLLATLLFCGPTFATFFTVPTTGTVFLKPVGGTAGAVSEFGFLASGNVQVPLFTGLPSSPNPNAEISLGVFTAGAGLDFYQKSVFGGLNGVAFSNASDQASLVAFTDTDNSLGMGGSVIQQTGPLTWVFHLDDALSVFFDDNDNDVLIQLRLEPSTVTTPEPSGIALLGLGIAGLAGYTWRRRKGIAIGRVAG